MFSHYRYLLICILLIVSVVDLIPSAMASWDSKAYKKHNYLSFSSTEKAQERIALNNIDYELLNAAIHFETNFQRESNGVSALYHSNNLERSASGHAEAMVKFNFFSHSSPFSRHTTLVDRLKKVGIENVYAAENIAISLVINQKKNRPKHSDSHASKPNEIHSYISLATSVVKQWMNSPRHKKNILNPKYQYLGNGSALFYDEEGVPFIKVVQNYSSKIE